MNREASNLTIAIVALVFSVAAAVFCGRLASNYATAAKHYECKVLSLKMHHDEPEHLMLNIRTLLFLNPEAFYRNRDRLPKPVDLPTRKEATSSSRPLETAERKKAKGSFDTYLGRGYTRGMR